MRWKGERDEENNGEREGERKAEGEREGCINGGRVEGLEEWEGIRSRIAVSVEEIVASGRTCNFQFRRHCCRRWRQNGSVLLDRNKARFCYQYLVLVCAYSKSRKETTSIRLRQNTVWCNCQ